VAKSSDEPAMMISDTSSRDKKALAACRITGSPFSGSRSLLRPAPYRTDCPAAGMMTAMVNMLLIAIADR
jgi:hypothetical protein